MSQTVQTQFGTGTVVDRESVRGRVSYKVEGPGFSTWVEASAMPLDFQWMPGPDDIQDNSTVLPYNPAPQTWRNPKDQNIVPGEQGIDPRKRTAPADSVDLQEESESYAPGPDPSLFATAGYDPEDIQAKLGPKYVNAFVEHDFTSLQARLEEHPEIVMAEARERVAELVDRADQEYLSRVGRNEYLEASDPQLREAAWADVRSKAVRLRKSGQINTRGATPDIIMAQVTGDHGTYEVIVRRSNIFQGNSSVDEWSCECPWGQWAFKREQKFVGRLCSHAYATLLELQAMTRSNKPNPKFRNQPAIFSSRTAAEASSSAQILTKNGWETVPFHRFVQFEFDSGTVVVEVELNGRVQQLELPRKQFKMNTQSSRTAEAVDIGSKIFHRDYADIYGTVVEDDGDAYLVDGDGGEYWIDHEDARLASRTAEIVDLRPVGWDPYSRNLMNKLQTLWEEGSRPGRQKERNDEIRGLVDELRDRGFATDGVIASLKEAEVIPEGTRLQNKNEGHGKVWVSTGEPGNTGLPGAGTFFYLESNPDIERVIPSGDQDYYNVLSSRQGFIDSPMGYGDIPDYGSSADYVLKHELENREDVTEPEFEYSAGGDHGVVNDLNDGGGERTSAYEDDYAYGEPPAYDSGDEYGGDENPYYVDPAEQTDWEDPLPESEADIVASFQRNAGHLLGGGGGSSGGNDDIAAAAEAHLRTAGRHFTMAEQQALIDEDDGQPYDRSGLRLDGTHYL